ncbi:hypothetical protein KFK09_010256 [Dendrobium nobile]|uniref:Uncharacterized protein n=1 Tax=Dendrobium nobile TaxID=94219 RepID=A0A8T3BLQ2_DENNO|nr:hypothetical protein KFK09_010256 [Dendrobium nobile]
MLKSEASRRSQIVSDVAAASERYSASVDDLATVVHLLPSIGLSAGGGTRSHVPCLIKARNSADIAERHSSCLDASAYEVGVLVWMVVAERSKICRGFEMPDLRRVCMG